MSVQAASLPCPDNALIGACFQNFLANFSGKISLPVINFSAGQNFAAS
jgi:hypothetical protein